MFFTGSAVFLVAQSQFQLSTLQASIAAACAGFVTGIVFNIVAKTRSWKKVRWIDFAATNLLPWD